MIRSIGSDPGTSGSIVEIEYVSESIVRLLSHHRLSTVGKPLNDYCSFKTPNIVICEQVGAMPTTADGQAVRGSKATFTFGESFGAVKQALSLIDPSYELVRPQIWQKHFGLVFPKDKTMNANQFKTWKKNQHKQYVLDTYGHELVHAEVDAFLIAVYGAELYLSRLKKSQSSEKEQKPTRRKHKRTSTG